MIVRAGRGSLHPRWLEGADTPRFDLLVAAYEEGAESSSQYQSSLIHIPGSKIAGYHQLFRQRPELLDQYEYFGLFDDDLLTTAGDINRLFALGKAHGLNLFQPALSWDSYFSYAATLANPGQFQLRYTNTVEMMCPVFSRDYLRRALPLFGLGYETGIDLIWARLSNDPWFRYAIIDAVAVTHTRAVGSTKDQQGFDADKGYEAQISEVLDRFGATFRGYVTYGGIDRQGRRVVSRQLMAWHSLSVWGAWRSTPLPLRIFARFVTDYTRHCVTRPLNLEQICGALRGASDAHSRY